MNLIDSEMMAEILVDIYKKIGKRYYMSKGNFRKLAGREKLHDSILWSVNSELHRKQYTLIDMRGLPRGKDYIGIIRIATIKRGWEKLTRQKFRNLKILVPGRGL